MKSAFLEAVNCVIYLVFLVSGCYCGYVFGEFIKGSEIMTIDRIGFKKCGQFCLSITGCLAYNYNKEMLHCQLLADNSSTGNLMESKKIRFENKENIPITPDMKGLCINAGCPKFFQCVKLSSSQETCVRQVCDDPPSPRVNSEAAASRKRFPVGTNLQYQCSISGLWVSNYATYKANGQWTSVNPMCECEYPDLPFESTPNCSHPGCEARFTCYGNRIVEGDNRMTCGNPGTWIKLGVYNCVPSGCDSPPKVLNAYEPNSVDITCKSTKCIAVYYCRSNFMHTTNIYDDRLSICSLTKTVKSWTVPKLQCHYDCASNRPVVENSTLLDPHCSTTCTYICNNGSTLVGQSVRLCSVENGWDGSSTSCKLD